MDDFYRIVGRSIGDDSWRVEMSVSANIESDGTVQTNTNISWIGVYKGTFDNCVDFVRENEAL